jgi:hypothetical protein
VINIANSVDGISKEIDECEEKLIEARNEKEYKIHCEEIAKLINSYDSKQILEEYSLINISQINALENENNKYINRTNNLMEKINNKSKKLSLLLKLVSELKSNTEEDISNINDKMVID